MADKNKSTKYGAFIPQTNSLRPDTGYRKGNYFKMTSKQKDNNVFEISFHWTRSDNGMVPSSMHISAQKNGQINADLLREIPIGKMLRDDVRMQRLELEQQTLRQLGVAKRSDSQILRIRRMGHAGRLKATHLKKQDRGRRIPDAELSLVAKLWHEARSLPYRESPDKYIARTLKITHSQARTRVYQCRQAGHLPPSTRGKARTNQEALPCYTYIVIPKRKRPK